MPTVRKRPGKKKTLSQLIKCLIIIDVWLLGSCALYRILGKVLERMHLYSLHLISA